MDALEKLYNKTLIEEIGSIKAAAFKKGLNSSENSKIYEASLKAMRLINLSENITESLTLLKANINKVKLIVGKPRNFVYCGCYMFRGEKTVLLELQEKIGTYYLNNSNIVRQLDNFKVGSVIGLSKENELSDGIKLLTINGANNIGLFEKF